MFKTTTAIVSAALASLLACSSSSTNGNGSGEGTPGDDAAAPAEGGSGGHSNDDDASAGGAACSKSELGSLVGPSCASCVASMCSDVLSECTTSCAHCAPSLIISCGDCASACVPTDSGSKTIDASTGTGAKDGSATAQGDGGAPTCAKLSACCAQVAAVSASEGTSCTQAAAANNESVCASVYMQVKAMDPFCM
jgi:hypothetical protein